MRKNFKKGDPIEKRHSYEMHSFNIKTTTKLKKPYFLKGGFYVFMVPQKKLNFCPKIVKLLRLWNAVKVRRELWDQNKRWD